MITPEEKKEFKRLHAISKTAQLGNFEWNWDDLDYKSERFLEPTVEEFVSDDTHRSHYPRFKSSYTGEANPYKIPISIAKAIHSYYMREVAPKIMDAYDEAESNVDSEISGSNLYFIIDVKNKEIKSWVDLSYYSQEDGESDFWEGDQDQRAMELLNKLREINPNASSVLIGFDGGGDSGSLNDKMIMYGQNNVQTNHDIPDDIADWCYNKLPGGWEIDEGSYGDFVFNLIDNDINLSVTYNTSEEISEWVIQESFE